MSKQTACYGLQIASGSTWVALYVIEVPGEACPIGPQLGYATVLYLPCHQGNMSKGNVVDMNYYY